MNMVRPMAKFESDVQSLTTFLRHSSEIVRHLNQTKRPVVLTVRGKAVAIVQDAEAYERLLDIAARADVVKARSISSENRLIA